jgi:hypothetical protein
MIEIPLTQNQISLIDDEDLELVSRYRWYAYLCPDTKSFYAATNIRKPDGARTQIKMHRLIMDAKEGQQVDHIHHLTLDNRKSQLRLCTKNQNQHNAVKRADNTSGYKGVDFRKTLNKWRARIMLNGKSKQIGLFTTPELANEACIAAREELHGDFSRHA